MSNRVVSISPQSPDPRTVKMVAEVLEAGGIVGLPTETVYGLAASCDRRAALERLRELKGRPANEPFPVQVASLAAAAELLPSVPIAARPLMKHFWPGPLTIVFPDAKLTLGGAGLGIRVPAHPVAHAVLCAVGEPLAVPSCNPRGEPPAVDVAGALRYFPSGLDLVVDAGPTQIREASTVVRVTGAHWELLREGLISREMIERLLRGRTYLFVCTGNTCRSPMAAALAARALEEHTGLSAEELGALGFRFLSAGTEAYAGERASSCSRRAMREHGADLEGHRTQRLSHELIAKADAIVCMEATHLAWVRELAPEALPRTRLLLRGDLEDPAGSDIEEYRRVRDAIAQAVKELVTAG